MASGRPQRPKPEGMIGPFVLTRWLGEGGFGVAYEAVDTRDKKPYVVKTINKERLLKDFPPEERIAAYQDMVRLFNREAGILESLDHENICRFHDADLSGKDPWFAMHLYRGNNIYQELQQYPNTPEEFWFSRAKDILSALKYAHSEGVIHGDLSPNNIIIDGRGAKLIDFGIARHFDGTNPKVSRVMYTPAYFSPEHIFGHLYFASDIFVAASLLTYLGTGEHAFKPEGKNDFRRSILEDEPDYGPMSSNQKMLLEAMHRKKYSERISAADAIRMIEKLSPASSVRSIVKPAAKAKPAAKTPVRKASIVEQFEARVAAKVAERQAPPGIELLPNGARVAGWQPKKERSQVTPGTWLFIASIATFGLALIPYWFVSRFSKSTKDFDQKIRVRLGISLAVYFLSFGMFAPFVTLWWARRIGFLHLKTILVVQSFTGFLGFVGTVAESGQSPSGFLWFIRAIGIFTCFWSYSVIKEKLGAKPVLEKKSKKERRAEASGEVTGGHQSWEEVKETFRSALSTRHGKRFIIEILSAEYQGIYFQGYSEPDGARTIEAAADLSVRPHITEDQKVKMSMIGWERPSEGLPNFIMFLEADESEDDDLADIFLKSLRDGYGLSIPKFRVMVKER